MTAEAAAGPRAGFVETALGPRGWREPTVWVVVVGWVAYFVWAGLFVVPGGDPQRQTFSGPQCLALGIELYLGFGPGRRAGRRLEGAGLLKRVSRGIGLVVHALFGVMVFSLVLGIPLLFFWDQAAARFVVVACGGAWCAWRLHADIEQRRRPFVSILPPERSGSLDLMRHDR